jgi:hypothetical protein
MFKSKLFFHSCLRKRCSTHVREQAVLPLMFEKTLFNPCLRARCSYPMYENMMFFPHVREQAFLPPMFENTLFFHTLLSASCTYAHVLEQAVLSPMFYNKLFFYTCFRNSCSFAHVSELISPPLCVTLLFYINLNICFYSICLVKRFQFRFSYVLNMPNKLFFFTCYRW